MRDGRLAVSSELLMYHKQKKTRVAHSFQTKRLSGSRSAIFKPQSQACFAKQQNNIKNTLLIYYNFTSNNLKQRFCH